MNKLYLLILLFFTSMLSFGQSFDDPPVTKTVQSTVSDIEGFNLYPNPVTTGKVTISTSRNLTKQVSVYDVLGKQVLNRKLFGSTLDVSSLTAGIYIIKVTEDKKTVTRKLVIK